MLVLSSDSPATSTAETAWRSDAFVACQRCPRLVAHREAVAREKRRAYRGETYWGKPVPSFGDSRARVALVGLAPGAHGSNRTGRHFTGDGSGRFLFPALFRAGFSNRPESSHLDDGFELRDLVVTAAARCVPPANKPTPAEIAACRDWLTLDLARVADLRVVLTLGQIAHRAVLDWQAAQRGEPIRKAQFPFSHGAEFTLPGGLIVLASYHVSQQNTNTGKLTASMFDEILRRARELAELPPCNKSTE